MFEEILNYGYDMTWDAGRNGDSDSRENKPRWLFTVFGNTALFDMGKYYKTNKMNLNEGFLHPASLLSDYSSCVWAIFRSSGPLEIFRHRYETPVEPNHPLTGSLQALRLPACFFQLSSNYNRQKHAEINFSLWGLALHPQYPLNPVSLAFSIQERKSLHVRKTKSIILNESLTHQDGGKHMELTAAKSTYVS